VGTPRVRAARLSRAAQPLARALANVVAVAPELLFASRIESALGGAGHEVRVVSSLADADLERAELIVADLERASPEELARSGIPVIGYYSHVDVDMRRRAEAAGLDLVVPRSRVSRELPALVERALGP
jgi:predicted NBD/HSP70 family sugar kinase